MSGCILFLFLGDVIAIYDTNGNKVVEYAYDAYGNCTIKGTTTNYDLAHANPIRYRGYYYDEDTKLYYLNARYYSPELRRFVSLDDTSYLDPESVNGLNLYCYCNNDPVNYCDPSGHKSKWWAWLLSGISVTAGIVLSATGIGGVLGGILIGAGAGSLINGYVNEANGGSFVGGYIGGAISGALCGLGAGWAGTLYMSATAASGGAVLRLLGASMATSFSLGFMGNMSGTLVTALWDKQSVNTKSLIHSSITIGALNILAGFGSGISSEIANLGKIAIDSNSQWAHRLLAGTVSGATEAFYDTLSYLYGFWN